MFAKVACKTSSQITAISRRMLFSSSCMVRGALKGKAYANKPRAIQQLGNNIRREIAAISEDVLQATFANMKRCVQLCLDSGDEHFQHLL
jgi:hypothetical protein